ncbi:class I SAM-dependent methyltransferase [Dyella subtropica]|uniref:class I SAM-dependent methyltransferase n=1 Tax=Dyella subtropica TaxID=2992127 RepID=UPI00225C3BF6|nr:class I SAM-dependent methyltransferase [Dyella subtropica]
MTQSHYEDPEFVRRYAQGPAAFVPAYVHMQRMAAQLMRERIGDTGQVLVLGAGGGLELEAFAKLSPQWTFVGVDPAKAMLTAAQERMRAAGASERVDWHHGYIFDAPAGPFDAATSLLTLHFVPDDGTKECTLREIHRRLKPGAPFMLVDLCIDLAASDAATALNRYREFALESGAQPEQVETTCGRLVTVLQMVSAERDEELLGGAGFRQVELFYAGLSWRGWRAVA